MISPTPDELIIGPYPYDTCKSSDVPDVPTCCGYSTATTEYNTDATKRVDHATDSGLEGGDKGGNTAVAGILEEAVVRGVSHMG